MSVSLKVAVLLAKSCLTRNRVFNRLLTGVEALALQPIPLEPVLESAPIVRIFMDLAGNHVANPENRVEIGNSLSHGRVPLKGPKTKLWKVMQSRGSGGKSCTIEKSQGNFDRALGCFATGAESPKQAIRRIWK